ncbi:MAG: hypothetical protein JNJ57_21285 [Saprospiraceae bacterium]|nr:hypothetical protein [Saprospiraceae bacterium]
MKKTISIILRVFYDYFEKKDPDIPYFSAVTTLEAIVFFNFITLLSWFEGIIEELPDLDEISKTTQYLIFGAGLLFFYLMIRLFIPKKALLELNAEVIKRCEKYVWLYAIISIVLFFVSGFVRVFEAQFG